jgi:threonine/homoserine/homoserine lactone efflux protein
LLALGGELLAIAVLLAVAARLLRLWLLRKERRIAIAAKAIGALLLALGVWAAWLLSQPLWERVAELFPT